MDKKYYLFFRAIKYLLGYGHLLGQDEHSWACDIPSRQVYHDAEVIDSFNMISANDIGLVISMKLNLIEGCLSFDLSFEKKELHLSYRDKSRYKQ